MLLYSNDTEEVREMTANQRIHHVIEQKATSRVGRQDQQKMAMILSTLETEFEQQDHQEKMQE